MLLALLLLPLTLAAQETTTAAPATTTTATSTTTTQPAVAASASKPVTSEEVRSEFSELLRRSPSELPTILILDPTLLSDEAYLRRYPELAQYIADHPQVRHNPRYYLREFRIPGERNGTLSDLMEGVTIFSTFLVIALAFAWLIRTLIEQKRWSRLAQTQSEVHKKILDRFGTSAELLEYINTPAGAKFLQSAPIPVHGDAVPQNAPVRPVLWSIQIGIVIAAAAVGMLIVSGRFTDETGQGLFAMGVIGLCVGAGFVGSALVSMFLSRRLMASADADASA